MKPGLEKAPLSAAKDLEKSGLSSPAGTCSASRRHFETKLDFATYMKLF
jgi:hypothetical protein